MQTDQLIAGMSRHGIKATPNRVLVARVLAEAGRPVSLGEIEQALDTVDKSGISRALSLFREMHFVHVLEDGGDAVRYELCHSHHRDADDDLHVHFYCEQCGRTFCLEDCALPLVSLPDGYIPLTANYIIKGTCPHCQ